MKHLLSSSMMSRSLIKAFTFTETRIIKCGEVRGSRTYSNCSNRKMRLPTDDARLGLEPMR